MQSNDADNTIFYHAAAFVNYTDRHLFLTGKAGTGKTTFLKYIKENCRKKLAIVAPTGVAAINAGGVTIHSLFQLPFGMYIPSVEFSNHFSAETNVYNKVQLLQKLKLNRAKREILQELELLIIDEVSMLRCDTLDAMDEILRHIRKQPNKPFGNVQVLFIGDLYQLPPVVKYEENALLKQYYATPFFFSACVLRTAPLVYLELEKVYRQSDERFVSLLNRIRENCIDENDLAAINRFYNPEFTPAGNDNYITLTSHNGIAANINQRALEKLPHKLYEFGASVEGEFPERMYPNDKTLLLKEGAQVMFIKNDKGDERKYFNGKIGIVEKIDKDKNIWIRFPEEEDLFELRKEEWKNIQYKYNNATDKIDDEEIGAFVQYPVRLAWAITIHKSQGLTFDKAVIDAGAAFAAGQVYVAFSRLRSTEGLVLRSKIYRSAVYTDEQILSFSGNAVKEDELKNLLNESQVNYIHHSILQAFDWEKLRQSWNEFIAEQTQKLFKEEAVSEDFMHALSDKIQAQSQTAHTFVKQLEMLLVQAADNGYTLLKQRLDKACGWFGVSLENELIRPVKEEILRLKEQRNIKKSLSVLSNLLISFERKKQELQHIVSVVQTMCETQNIGDWLERLNKKEENAKAEIDEKFFPNKKLQKGETYNITLNLYQQGKTVDEISKERNLAKSTIEGHLVRFIETGEVNVFDFMKEDEFLIINQYMETNPQALSSEIYISLGEKYSYTQLRAAAAYRKKLEKDGKVKQGEEDKLS
ncbi:MAG: helix-turn-helix domain-containing protein [Arachidicoccus sp.]|nr:helix-turn-helix domain-containing protein [Arachidicoccus sp.]